MTDPSFEDRPVDPGFPEIVDDDSPERDRYPEPEAPALSSDDGYPGSSSVGTTVEEEIEGESLDQKLAREVPEPQEDPLRPRDVDEPREDAELPEEGAHVGQLVAPDEGAGADEEKDEIASELGTAYDEAPEESAMHIEQG